MWIELDGWKAKLRFSACHIIPYHKKCGRLHGHTYAVSVKIIGEQFGEFIIDFEVVKQIVSELCDKLDHRVLLAEKDPRLSFFKDKESVKVVIQNGKTYLFPLEDVVFLPIDSLSAEDLCKYFTKEIAKRLKVSNLTKIYVRVDEGIGQGVGCELGLRS